MKLSEIEKITGSRLIIGGGEQEWIEPSIEINFKLPSEKMTRELGDIYYKLREDTNLHMVYITLPILTDIEIDKDEEWFKQQHEGCNYVAVVIFNAVMKKIQANLSYFKDILDTDNRLKKISANMSYINNWIKSNNENKTVEENNKVYKRDA